MSGRLETNPSAFFDVNACGLISRSPPSVLVRWATAVNDADSNLLPDLAKKQRPQVLWIGCADSRVPESVITLAKPGDIFVHRNIANQFHPDDGNALSVLSHAVEQLNEREGVKHIIVVGHANCGGVRACLNNPRPSADTPTGRWLKPVIDLAIALEKETEHQVPRPGIEELKPILIERNVKLQVDNIADSDILQRAWAAGKNIQVHGWVYDTPSGILKDLGYTREA